MIAIGFALVVAGFIIGLAVESWMTVIATAGVGLATVAMAALPAPGGIVLGCVLGWLMFAYAGLALTAYWKNRYKWTDPDGGVAGSIIVAPAYVVLGLIIWGGVVVWDRVDKATRQ